MPVKGLAALDLRGERMPLDIGVGDLEQRPYVSPLVRLDSALEGLDVLLRHHRSRSIPPRGGGCQSKTALSEDRRLAKLAQLKRGLNPPHKPSGPRGGSKGAARWARRRAIDALPHPLRVSFTRSVPLRNA